MAIRSYGTRRTKHFARGDRRALPPDLVGRIEPLLNALDRADSLADLDLPGARLHAYDVEVVDYSIFSSKDEPEDGGWGFLRSWGSFLVFWF